MVSHHVPAKDNVFAALIEEQSRIQAGKCTSYTLRNYNDSFFPGCGWDPPRRCEVTDFIRHRLGARISTFDGMLRALSRLHDGPVHWANMGGGRGIAMRELAVHPRLRGRFHGTSVDLFDYGLAGLEPSEITYLEEHAPGCTAPPARPQLILADATTVTLPQPAQLLTALEVMQYLNDPLAAICNWYNNLSDGSLLLIATEHDFSSWIRYQRMTGVNDYDLPTLGEDLLRSLRQQGLAVAATRDLDTLYGHRSDRFNGYCLLALERRPGSKLQPALKPVKIWTNPYDYKAVYYHRPASSTPVVRLS